MVFLSAWRLTNVEIICNQKLVCALNHGKLRAISENNQKMVVLEKYFMIPVENIFHRKFPVIDIVIELENISYIKNYFNNNPLTVDIKPSSEVIKNALYSIKNSYVKTLFLWYCSQQQIKIEISKILDKKGGKSKIKAM